MDGPKAGGSGHNDGLKTGGSGHIDDLSPQDFTVLRQSISAGTKFEEVSIVTLGGSDRNVHGFRATKSVRWKTLCSRQETSFFRHSFETSMA